MMLSKRCFATTGRTEQRIGAAICKSGVDFLQRVIRFCLWVGDVGVADMIEVDPSHRLSP